MDQTLVVALHSTAPTARCPGCPQPSVHIHRHYERRPTDLPWGGTPLRLLLGVRKFFSRTPAGPRRILTERLPSKSPWLNPIEPKWMHGKQWIIEPARLLTAQEIAGRSAIVLATCMSLT